MNMAKLQPKQLIASCTLFALQYLAWR